MTGIKKRTEAPGELEGSDLLEQVLEDIYVDKALGQHGRSVRLVTHEGSDTVELLSCDRDAVERARSRLTSGSFTVRGSVLRRPDDAELVELMRHHPLGRFMDRPEKQIGAKAMRPVPKGRMTAKAKLELALDRADGRPEGDIIVMLARTKATPKEREQVEKIMLKAALRPEKGERER